MARRAVLSTFGLGRAIVAAMDPRKCLPGLLLAAVLAAPVQAARPTGASDTALHAYVMGRYAALDNDVATAARLMAQARAADPAAGSITRRAFALAIAAGDQNRAFQLARVLAATEPTDDVTITRLAEAAIKRDWAGMATLRRALGRQGWPLVAGPIIDAWIAAGRGDASAALVLLDPQRHRGFMRGYMAEQRAHLLASLGRWDEAATAYRQARATGGVAQMFLRQGQADALAMAGRDRKSVV